MIYRTRLYGLTVSAPFALGLPVDPDTPLDVRITVDDAPLEGDQDREPEGRVVARYVRERPFYTLVDRGEFGHLFRFHRFADVEIAADSGVICCRLVAGAVRELLPVILAGNVMAALLLLRGELVLHSSAVERGGRTVALVASSGGGKSTLAAMVCAAGASLVTDDVLRVEMAGAGVSCYRGTGALRLRPGSKALATGGAYDDDGGERSADGRHLLSAPPTAQDTVGLDAIVIPRLRPADQPLVRTELDAKAGLFALLAHPRVESWVEPATAAAQFTKLVTLVDRVPVAYLDVPWGVALDPTWFERLRDLLFAPPAAKPILRG